jgi:hypothetical protein
VPDHVAGFWLWPILDTQVLVAEEISNIGSIDLGHRE